MKLTSLLGILLIGTSSAFADAPTVQVTETFGTLTHSPSPSGKSEVARAGTVLGDKESLQTGKAALTEIEWTDHAITRLAPDTRFDYVASAHEANLQSGTMVFSLPKDGKGWTLQTKGLSATITGATGFVEKEGNSVLLGVIEGKVLLQVGPSKAILQAGKMLAFVAGSNPRIVAFDVPDFVRTSAFFHRFQRPLPNEKYVEREIAEYNDLVARGFIAPLQGTLSPSDHPKAFAAAAMAGRDSAGTALNASNIVGATVASAGSTFSGATVSGSGVSSYSGGLTINTGANNGATLSLVGAGGSLIANGGTLIGNNTLSNGTVANVTLTKSGTDTLVLTGANTYGGSVITGNGTLNPGNGTSLGTTAHNYTGGTTVYTGGATFGNAGIQSGISGSSNLTILGSATGGSNGGGTITLAPGHH